MKIRFCKRGHEIVIEYRKDGKRKNCPFCNKMTTDNWKNTHEEEYKNYMREYLIDYRTATIDKRIVYDAERYAREKDVIKQAVREYNKNNRGKVRAWRAKRRAAKLRAIVPWSDLSAISKFYENRPDGHHVDHIIPLQGKTVCGLHVLENLQYLPAVVNIKKKNKLVTDE